MSVCVYIYIKKVQPFRRVLVKTNKYVHTRHAWMVDTKGCQLLNDKNSMEYTETIKHKTQKTSTNQQKVTMWVKHNLNVFQTSKFQCRSSLPRNSSWYLLIASVQNLRLKSPLVRLATIYWTPQKRDHIYMFNPRDTRFGPRLTGPARLCLNFTLAVLPDQTLEFWVVPNGR